MHLLFDIGGTKMRLAVTTDGENFGEPKVSPTPEHISDLVLEFKKLADELTGGVMPLAIAGGITLKKAEAIEEIKKLFSCPVYVENDAALAGLGEAKLVAEKIVAYITVSTGVGGARIVEGQIDHVKTPDGVHVASSEPGHQIIDFNQPEKHLEDYISGRAIKLARGVEPQDITDEAFWSDLAKILAIGLHNTILHWTPEVIILGGSMMREPGIPLEVVEKQLEQSLSNLPFHPQLKLAQLGDLGGLHGALAFLKQKSVS